MRMIDADATKRRVADTYFDTLIPCVNRALDDSPTIDAVPVVRCRECKLWLNSKLFPHNHYCIRSERVAYPDDFCSYGEKRCDEDGTT